MSAENIHQTLHTIFHEGLTLYNDISNSDQPTNSAEVQGKVLKSIQLLEQATRLVSLADIFSKNEDLDELATNDIQYLLLPALLGFSTTKVTSRERKEVVEVAEIYFKDFLSRTNQYKLSNYKLDSVANVEDQSSTSETELEQLTKAVNIRANKIKKYTEHRELKSQLETLKVNVENEYADEEIKRNYFLTMLKVFIHDVVDELESIKMEKPILEHIGKIKQEGIKPAKRQPPPPLKPIIITKDEVQKAIYGAGYPALPTMTVDEFYEKRVAEGAFPDPNKPKTAPMSLQEASLAGLEINNDDKEDEELERHVEEDDEEYLERMRARDEHRDDHRRGWGNRLNRS